jgi:hypothetical protein
MHDPQLASRLRAWVKGECQYERLCVRAFHAGTQLNVEFTHTRIRIIRIRIIRLRIIRLPSVRILRTILSRPRLNEDLTIHPNQPIRDKRT